MKKHLSKILGVILVLVAVIGVCLNPSAIKFLKNATGSSNITYYQTVESNVKTRTGPGEKYDKNVITISKKGTVLKVIGSTKNSSGNTWYKLNNNYWVYSKRVTKHSHSYLGGYCTANQCGYEYPLKYESSSMTIRVKNSSGCKAWTRPYQDNSKNPVTYAYGKELKVVQKTTNQAGNLWFKVDSGYWVYSGNVEQIHTVKYDANGGSGAPGAQKFVSGGSMTISSTKPTRKGYDFKGWSTSSSSSSVSYTPGSKYSEKKSRTLYAVWAACDHNYYGGICKKCGYEYPLSVSSYSGTFTVTNPDGAKIWSRPYSENSNSPYKSPNGTNLTVVGKVTNVNESGKPKNLWYKLSNGYWVFSGNVAQRYTITYNANGGSGAPGAQYCLDGKSVTLSSAQPKCPGFLFQGWATSSSSSVSYKAGSKYSFNKNITLYAVWKRCSHPSYYGGICKTCNEEAMLLITFTSGEYIVTNPDGAKAWSRPYSENSKHIRTHKKGTTLSVVAQTTNIDSKGKPHNLWYQLNDSTWVFSGNVGQQCTVYYNANGGSGAPSAQNCVSGQSVTLSKTKPSKVGYTFLGWSTSSGSSKVTYKAGSKYSFKSNTTLYAVWEKCKHPSYSGGICKTCKYEYPLKETAYNGTFRVTTGSGAPVWSRPYQDNSKKVDTYGNNKEFKVIAKVTNINSSGKSGNLWYKISDGKWIYSGNITQLYTVTYNANGGNGAPGAQKFLSGKTVTLSKTKPTKVGYIFKGWATSSGSSKVSYDPGEKYGKDQNLTLYAVWKKCSHNSYDSTGVCKTCKYKYQLEVDGTFRGVYIVTNSSGAPIRNVPYEAKNSIVRTAKKNSSLTVVGKAINAHNNLWYKLSDGNWVYSKNVEKGYIVTYNANGGTGAPASSSFVSGKLVVTTKKPKRTNYTFMGWSTSKSAKKASYKSGDTYNVKKDITLYAVWQTCKHSYNKYGICKNCNGEYPLTVTSLTETVYTVNNRNGVTAYKRPYTDKKATTLKNGTPVLVIGKVKNKSGDEWYKLYNNTWIRTSELKKRTTYHTIDDIPGDRIYALCKSGGIKKTISGAPYYYVSGKTTSGKSTSFYLDCSAFTGRVKNTQYSKISSRFTEDMKDRVTCKSIDFSYSTQTSGKTSVSSFSGKIQSSTCPLEDGIARPYTQSHTHYTWDISSLTAYAYLSGDDTIVLKVKNNTDTCRIEYCTEHKTIVSCKFVESNFYPKLSVSASPHIENGRPTGWFTNFDMEGKGLKTKDFTFSQFIDLASCAVKIGVSVSKLSVKTTPTEVFNLLTRTWTFVSKASNINKPAEYTSKNSNQLTYQDNKTGEQHLIYELSAKSPIKLQAPGNYFEIRVHVKELNDNQNVTIKFEL